MDIPFEFEFEFKFEFELKDDDDDVVDEEGIEERWDGLGWR